MTRQASPLTLSTAVRLLALNVPGTIHWLTDGRVSVVLPVLILCSLVLGFAEHRNASHRREFIGLMTRSTLASCVLSLFNPLMWESGSSCMPLPGWVGLPIVFGIAWIFSCIGAGAHFLSARLGEG